MSRTDTPDDPAAQGITRTADAVERLDFNARYRRGAPLGEGGMGSVYLYEDRQIGRSIALKRMQPEAQSRPESRLRFIREARVQGQLEHPSIVPVYDLGIDERGAIYFTMKRVRGVTLEEIVEGRAGGDVAYTRRFSDRQLLSAFARVCLAVDFAHERGVVHRDLKPSNIMLGDYGEVYVLDWGVAKVRGVPDDPPSAATPTPARDAVDVTTGPDSILGTPGYIAPEELRREDARGQPTADVYALGAILHELLTGAPLHQGTFAERIRSTLEGPDARPRDALEPELAAVCARATARDHARRYPSARALHDAVEAFLDGQRDGEVRRRLAGEHAARARAAAARALRGELELDEELAERRAAMAELGRALALEPENQRALETMVQLLVQPPNAEPPAVADEMNRVIEEQLRRIARVAVTVYLGLFLYIPVLLWAGVRDSAWIIALFVFSGLAALTSAWVARSHNPRRKLVVPLICSTLAMTMTAGLFGPLVSMPAFVAINGTAYFVYTERRRRAALIAIMLLAIAVPFALELAGVLAPSYAFEDGEMRVLPRAIALSKAAAYVLLIASAATSVFMATAISVLGVDSLHAAQRRVHLFNWHLGHVLPRATKLGTRASARGTSA
ncbi:MAG: serine/threonine protein kinase [Myxococcales bacterium]|nr:serine/threonine protein kinase [Myxococcales bacterium]